MWAVRHHNMFYNKIMCHLFQIQFFQFEELPSVLQTGPIKHPLRRRRQELRPGFNYEINRKLLWAREQWRLQQGNWNSSNFIRVRHLIIKRRAKNGTKDFSPLLPGFINNWLHWWWSNLIGSCWTNQIIQSMFAQSPSPFQGLSMSHRREEYVKYIPWIRKTFPWICQIISVNEF